VDAPVGPNLSGERLEDICRGYPVPMKTEWTHKRRWRVTRMAGEENVATEDG